MISNIHPFSSSLSWPCGLAELCSRLRRKGTHCLSGASLRAAEVGEPRGHPKGQATANMVLATFAETKVARLPGRNPASPNSNLDMTVGLTEEWCLA